jgi:HAD superfamily hydrolase (TIGR01549 family)
MKLQAILFDLDGTLLPMDTDRFVYGYLHMLFCRLEPYGYDEKTFMGGMWQGVAAMVKNDRSRCNEDVFWEIFETVVGKDIKDHLPIFEKFYVEEFDSAIKFTSPTPLARLAVDIAKEKAEKVVLATNPFYPPIATEKRARWAGLSTDEFDLVTHYENSGSCKPNPAYYLEIADKLELDPACCLMVGNHTEEDIVAAQSVGMKTFLLTDHAIVKGDMPETRKGSFEELIEFLKSL